MHAALRQVPPPLRRAMRRSLKATIASAEGNERKIGTRRRPDGLGGRCIDPSRWRGRGEGLLHSNRIGGGNSHLPDLRISDPDRLAVGNSRRTRCGPIDLWHQRSILVFQIIRLSKEAIDVRSSGLAARYGPSDLVPSPTLLRPRGQLSGNKPLSPLVESKKCAHSGRRSVMKRFPDLCRKDQN